MKNLVINIIALILGFFAFWRWGKSNAEQKHANNRIQGLEELDQRRRDINVDGTPVFLRKKAANKRKLF